ncbi:hypothetical protein [Tateyamaria omphalii]|uniref:Phosphoadenosine phosphosulfate reductase n=1 Tax=Tateyamaria omphalii TaxID=299262 RepID=A0A1P8MUM4_9RHOB|nr:hypothetical protein [Tateyamaria omphalii]APX11797.1 hypothetical protein BWR18_08960 [Tateyamaria omphalii]
MKLEKRHREAGALAEREGFCHVMRRHAAMFFDRGPARLVVTFDNLVSPNAPLPHYPWAYSFVERMGASHLGLIMSGPEDWFRHEDVLDFFDILQDDGFFSRFGEVVFYGSSMGGYGALTFARAAPGCRVVAFVPQTQLDPVVVPFETRYRQEHARGQWWGRYLDGVDGARAAAAVYVLYDPYFAPDAQHVARLDPANMVPMRLPWSTHQAGPVLRRSGQLAHVLESAFSGRLDAQGFRRAVRGAGRSGMGARLILRAGLERGHPALVQQVLQGLRASHPDWDFPMLRQAARHALYADESANR